jgi:[acyl-carrier-protein] S-malonyltransferase
MAALLSPDITVEAAAEIAAEAEATPDGATEVCEAANDNAPGQVVISGHKDAVDRAVKIAAEKGFRKAIMLKVSAPFHCRLMQPAADAMAEALAKATIAPLALPVIANVTAAPVTTPAEVRRLLVEQVTGRVRWRESVLAMKAAGVNRMVELGAGKALTGLVKRIDSEISGSSVGTPSDIEVLLGSL